MESWCHARCSIEPCDLLVKTLKVDRRTKQQKVFILCCYVPAKHLFQQHLYPYNWLKTWYFVTKIVRKNCSSDREKLLKFEAEGREFAKILRSLKYGFNKKYFRKNEPLTRCWSGKKQRKKCSTRQSFTFSEVFLMKSIF